MKLIAQRLSVFCLAGCVAAAQQPQTNPKGGADDQTVTPRLSGATMQAGVAWTFQADFTCSRIAEESTFATPTGFNLARNQQCDQGFVFPLAPGSPMSLVRSLAGSRGAPDEPTAGPEAFVPAIVQARLNISPGANMASVGFHAAPAGTFSTDPEKHLLVAVTPAGFGLNSGGNFDLLAPVGGSARGTRGSTDSGLGLGWAALPAGVYDATLVVPEEGSVLVSLVRAATLNNRHSFRLPMPTLPVCDAPCGELQGEGGLQNLEVNGIDAGDRIANVAYVAGPVRSSRMALPQGEAARAGLLLRWYIGADGSTCEAGSTQCTNVWAWVPPGFAGTADTPWVMAFHGYGEDGQMVQREYNNDGANVSDTLYQQGYVIVSIDNVDQNCYGNKQCVADVKNAMATVSSALTLAPKPYLMADSMGGEQMLNAVSHGVVSPRAMVGFCINTSLRWQYYTNGQAIRVQAAYDFDDDADYADATDGYDPLLASGEALSNLTQVPTLLFESSTDHIVAKKANTDAYAAMIHKAGGKVTVVLTKGDHLDPSNFPGARVSKFFKLY